MSVKKRHLSNKQHHNAKKSRKKLTTKEKLVEEFDELINSKPGEFLLQKGIVISRYGKQADVMPLDNNCFTENAIRCYMKALLEDLVVGDYVYYHKIDNEHYYIVDKEERKSLLARWYFNKMRNVAANIDTMIITSSINPDLNTEIIDRYLVAAHSSNIKPLILINKIDLINDDAKDETEKIINYYQKLGYDVIGVSAVNNINIDKIKEHLNIGLHIFVGQTGVGKSSLINRIFGQELMKVGEINEQTRLGKHTTTTSRIFKINSQSALIDSPGIREFSIENYSQDEVFAGFKEIANSPYRCKFSDCNHKNNLGCKIPLLVKEGKITDFRLENLYTLLKECENKIE